MKENAKVKVHLFDTVGKEIKTRNSEKVFTVYKKNGRYGIDWDIDSTSGDAFVPLYHFTSSTVLEDISTGKKYYFDNIRRYMTEI
jgi:ATP-dependent RNA circularization protein (DNA/RNA ligase family)